MGGDIALYGLICGPSPWPPPSSRQRDLPGYAHGRAVCPRPGDLRAEVSNKMCDYYLTRVWTSSQWWTLVSQIAP